jgi:HlyD family secretion protein
MRATALVLLVIVAVACDNEETALPLVGTLEQDRLELVAEANERIVEVHVSEGQRVEEGELLARLDSSAQKAEVKAVAAARERAAQQLAELIRGPREERIRAAEARLRGARDNLAIQQSELRRIESLVERELASASDLDRMRNSVEGASAEVDADAAALDELLDGTTKEELAQAEAALAEAEARLEKSHIVASRLDIVAPRAGRIETLPFKLGERPPAGAPVIVMLAGDAPYARVFVPEPLRAQIVSGLDAIVSVDGMPEPFAGRVRYVAAEAAFTPYYALTQRDRSRLAFLAEITLIDDSAADLPVGVPVRVDFPSLR